MMVREEHSNQESEKKPKTTMPAYYFSSFVVVYILLVTTGSITLIEALKTDDPVVRHMLNLETCISIVAGFFYYKFIELFTTEKEPESPQLWEKINEVRYLDWSITTPMMLLVLLLFLAQHNKTVVHIGTFLIVLFLNFTMLLFGYLGDIGKIDLILGSFISFVAFFAMFGFIFVNYIQNTKCLPNKVIFYSYFLTWSLYGVNYYQTNVFWKNSIYNVLDLISKCFIGLSLWLYFTKTLQ